jgi:hypothetical protein
MVSIVVNRFIYFLTFLRLSEEHHTAAKTNQTVCAIKYLPVDNNTEYTFGNIIRATNARIVIAKQFNQTEVPIFKIKLIDFDESNLNEELRKVINYYRERNYEVTHKPLPALNESALQRFAVILKID